MPNPESWPAFAGRDVLAVVVPPHPRPSVSLARAQRQYIRSILRSAGLPLRSSTDALQSVETLLAIPNGTQKGEPVAYAQPCQSA